MKGERKHANQKEKKHILTFSFMVLLKEMRISSLFLVLTQGVRRQGESKISLHHPSGGELLHL